MPYVSRVSKNILPLSPWKFYFAINFSLFLLRRLISTLKEKKLSLLYDGDHYTCGSEMTVYHLAHLPERSESAGQWCGQRESLMMCFLFLRFRPLGSLPV